jgi:hypothetical protein
MDSAKPNPCKQIGTKKRRGAENTEKRKAVFCFERISKRGVVHKLHSSAFLRELGASALIPFGFNRICSIKELNGESR